ncbi:hypothetical protein BGX24_004852, partial [Mortierella sp. AD032]
SPQNQINTFSHQHSSPPLSRCVSPSSPLLLLSLLSFRPPPLPLSNLRLESLMEVLAGAAATRSKANGSAT